MNLLNTINFNLTKKEISKDALRRVILELVSSKILDIFPKDSYKLRVVNNYINYEKVIQELYTKIGPHPFVYNEEEIVKEISPKVDVEYYNLLGLLAQFIENDRIFEKDESGKIGIRGMSKSREDSAKNQT